MQSQNKITMTCKKIDYIFTSNELLLLCLNTSIFSLSLDSSIFDGMLVVCVFVSVWSSRLSEFSCFLSSFSSSLFFSCVLSLFCVMKNFRNSIY